MKNKGQDKDGKGKKRERSDAKRWVTLPGEAITVVNRRTGDPIRESTAAVYDKDADGNFYLMKPAEQGDPQPDWETYDALYIFCFQLEGWDKPLRRKRIMRRVLDAFERADPGTVVELWEDDWREVKDFLETEDWGCPEPYGSQLVELFDAICDAKDYDPRIPQEPEDEAPAAAATA